MTWTKLPDGTYVPAEDGPPTPSTNVAYSIRRDRAARLYIPCCNGRPIKTSGKPGYFILAEAKRCCERHYAHSSVHTPSPHTPQSGLDPRLTPIF